MDFQQILRARNKLELAPTVQKLEQLSSYKSAKIYNCHYKVQSLTINSSNG